MNYNTLAKEIYTQNKAVGWWDEPDRCKLTLLQLVSTEIAEATEAERKDLMDDHLPHRKGGEVELADAMIRLLDMAGAYGWVYADIDDDGWYSDIIEHMYKVDTIGGKHLFINMSVIYIATGVFAEHMNINESYSLCLKFIQHVANSQGYDLEGALREKLAYNAKRQDHKRENRAAKGGKKF